MANCILCSTELKFINTPVFGSGKLSDGSTVCISCFNEINNINPSIALKLKNHSLVDIKKLLDAKQNDSDLKNARLNEIKKQIQELKSSNTSNYLVRKEINELPQILAESETIDNIAQGTYNNGQGILVSTNRRLVFVDKGLLYGLKVEDFPLDKITTIQYETGLLFGEIKIHTSGNVAKIDNVEKATARAFAEFVRNKLSQPRETTAQIANNQPDIYDQLEKLAKLKEKGILTQEEFDTQKKKLLNL